MPINKRQLDGWLVIDKPLDMGSTVVVGKLKWALEPAKIGHAGTLDPLATGVLPIALGKATRLIPYVMDGRKVYEFQITWGAETATDDAAGEIIGQTDKRPTETEIRAILPRFLGEIMQLPPAYSALKINGKRAYDLARRGEEVALKPRPVRIETLELVSRTEDTADFRVVCGKGTYVRSLGRDIGRALGCLGYITRLRRTVCGPFTIKDAVPMRAFEHKCEKVNLMPLDTALDTVPAVATDAVIGVRLRQGQRVPVREITDAVDCPEGRVMRVIADGELIGLVRVAGGVLHPYRIL